MMPVLTTLLLTAVADAGEWEVRYSNFPTITAEQRAAGWVPGWTLQVGTEDGLEVLALAGDEGDAHYIGQVYLARRLTLPDPLPRYLVVSLELQAACSEPDRSPPLGVLLLTPAAFEQLSTDPTQAGPAPSWTGEQAVVRAAISYPEDTVEWFAWKSPNLALRLTPAVPRELLLVLTFSGNHSGGREFARFRRVEVTMGQEAPAVPPREPHWPLKSARTLHSDEEIALARRRVAEDAAAGDLLKGIIKATQRWLAVPDEELRWRIPDSSVPRAFDQSAAGCPIHGKEVYRHGTYPWLLDFDNPFTIKCPVGGEVYPTGDFLAWYRGGRQDPTLVGGEYRDDGWGWVSPTGERHWLVAYGCHWHWSRAIIPGVLNLSRAYLLTGDRTYAHKAAALLYRIAEVYPGMDYEYQSRYGTLSPGYNGKILNHIWETGVVRNLAEAYDNIWDAIDDDEALQQATGLRGEEIRAFIEANLLEDAIDGVLEGKIQGNYGMHQSALATLVAVRQHAPGDELMASILDRTGAEGRYEGVRYALYNWIHRDGVPYETGIGYCFSWVANLTELATLTDRAGIDLFAEPPFRRLLQWPIDICINDRFTPALGDSGSVAHGFVGPSFDVYREAFARYGGADFAWMFERSGGRQSAFRTFDSLFLPPLGEALKRTLAEHPRESPPSRVLDGFGMAILNNAAQTLGAQVYYGWRGGHSHRDGLTIDFYAHGRPVTPDLGYPDAMNAFVSGIYSWSQATIAHNTVQIDSRQQTGNSGGRVLRFGAAPSLQFVDVEAPGNYPACSEYRRALLLISTDETNGYLIDIFRVAGGEHHDYSLHGPVGGATVVQGEFGPPQERGTLAGENVAVGELYDDPVLGQPGYRGGYSSYVGSGYQHLVLPRRQIGEGPVTVEMTPANEPPVKLRVHLPGSPGQRAVLAEAQVSPMNRPERLPFLIAQRSGPDLHSTFVSVLEPFIEQPEIEAIEPLRVDEDAVALVVRRSGGTDVVLQARDEGRLRQVADWFATDSAVAVVTFTSDGGWRRATAQGGTILRIGEQALPIPPPARGEVVAVDPPANTVTVAWDGPAPADNELVGRHLFVGNEQRDNVFRVAAVTREGARTVLTMTAGLLCGRGRVTGVDDEAKTISSDTRFMFTAMYPGMRALNERYEGFLPIRAAGRTFQLETAEALSTLFTDADGDGKSEFWVCVVGPGDRVRLVRTLTAEP